MKDEVTNTTRCVVGEDERYPTLRVDDMSWAEPETIAILDDEGAFVEIPDELIHRLESATAELRLAEDAIRSFLANTTRR